MSDVEISDDDRNAAGPRGRMRGVTLIEIVLVLIIAGILAAIAVPNFQGAQQQLELDEVKSRLVSDLRILRGTAMRCGGVAEDEQPRLHIDADGWEMDSSNCPGGGQRNRSYADLTIQVMRFPNDPTGDNDDEGEETETPLHLTFEYPHGEVDPIERHRIRLSAAGAKAVLCIYPESGSVVQNDDCSSD